MSNIHGVFSPGEYFFETHILSWVLFYPGFRMAFCYILVVMEMQTYTATGGDGNINNAGEEEHVKSKEHQQLPCLDAAGVASLIAGLILDRHGWRTMR